MTELFTGLSRLPASFPTSTTPAYSDIGFVLLSYIAETIMGKKFKQLLEDTVLGPLNLTHTFLSAPDDSMGIIPGSRYKTSWAFDMNEEEPSVFKPYLQLSRIVADATAGLETSIPLREIFQPWDAPF
jgi:CubicO group peptidase (beta-lactamase class C family)